MILRAFFSAAIALALIVQPTAADETCMSPYMAKIVGQEDYVYIWTLGLEGVGDGEDKLVTVDVNPDSETYGTVIHSISMGGRHEAHHSGLTIDATCGHRAWIPAKSLSSMFTPILRPLRSTALSTILLRKPVASLGHTPIMRYPDAC
jgi:selenium-binding protein 1